MYLKIYIYKVVLILFQKYKNSYISISSSVVGFDNVL